MLGAIGNCGQMCCCRRFMRKFVPVTIKMAKEQNLFLNPTKISGICGRLLCCLSYEYCTYVEALKDMPKRKKKVQTPYGVGTVKDLAPISKTVFVFIPDHGVKELGLDEIEEVKNPESPQQNQQKQPSNNQNNRRQQRKNRRPRRNPTSSGSPYPTKSQNCDRQRRHRLKLTRPLNMCLSGL
jgi:cell fate regulator YaaT (PSP1 superfamily)